MSDLVCNGMGEYGFESSVSPQRSVLNPAAEHHSVETLASQGLGDSKDAGSNAVGRYVPNLEGDVTASVARCLVLLPWSRRIRVGE